MKQEDIIQFQLMSNELQQVQEFMQHTDQQILEVNNLIVSLDAFATQKAGSTMLFPLANGIFAEGTLTDTKTLRVNVGQGVVVPRSVEETQDMIGAQLDSLREQQVLANKHQDELYEKLQKLEKRVREEMDK